MISSSTSRVPYTLSSTTETLAVPFYFLESSHLKVIKTVAGVQTTLTLGTHYSVTGAGVMAGGSITMTGTGVATGNTITIKRSVPFTQLVDYIANDRFPADTHEKALDKLTMLCQFLQEQAARSLRFEDGEDLDGTLALADRKGKYPYFNATDGTVEFGEVQELLDAADEAAASAAAAAASAAAAAGGAGQWVEKSANFTAANDGYYRVTASATVTNPTPAQGKGYMVDVRSGTATIGGTDYLAPIVVRASYNSGAWGYSAYANAVESAQAVSDRTSVAWWGDSRVEGFANSPMPQQFSALTGFGFYNGGIGSQTSTQIKDRMIADTAKHGWPTVIVAGRNGPGPGRTIEQDIDDMIAALAAAGNDRYVIFGNIPSETETVGTPAHNAILAQNAAWAVRYAGHFYNELDWVLTGALAAVGITPTGTDTANIANQVPPASLRYDSLHFNTAGYAATCIKLQSDYLGILAGEYAAALSIGRLYAALQRSGVLHQLATTAHQSRNLRVGWDAGNDAMTGTGNALSGPGAGKNLTSGSNNSLSGAGAGDKLTTASGNTLDGFQVARGATTITSNTISGANAFAGGAFSGTENDASGIFVGYSATSASYNTWHGAYAAYSATSASYSCAIGYYAGYGVTTANNWTAVGVGAMQESNGSGVTAVGRNAGRKSGNSGLYLGDSAGRYETGANKLFIDNQGRTDEATARTNSLVYGQFGTGVADVAQWIRINGQFACVARLYANDAAADADSTLLSGMFYKIIGSRIVYQKP